MTISVICDRCRTTGCSGTGDFAHLGDLLDFTPVPRKMERVDGWTADRQRAFIAALSATGSKRRAARAIGMAASASTSSSRPRAAKASRPPSTRHGHRREGRHDEGRARSCRRRRPQSPLTPPSRLRGLRQPLLPGQAYNEMASPRTRSPSSARRRGQPADRRQAPRLSRLVPSRDRRQPRPARRVRDPDRPPHRLVQAKQMEAQEQKSPTPCQTCASPTWSSPPKRLARQHRAQPMGRTGSANFGEAVNREREKRGLPDGHGLERERRAKRRRRTRQGSTRVTQQSVIPAQAGTRPTKKRRLQFQKARRIAEIRPQQSGLPRRRRQAGRRASVAPRD